MIPRAIFLAGLGFGDEGKGTTVEYLVAREKSDLVVRYNGGPQAAHNVVRDDGAHHTFAQFGSGTFQGARTHLSRFMLVDPLALVNEGQHLESLGYNAFKGITIERECPLVTPYHRAANIARERARGDDAHGSCGMGVGEAYVDVRDFPDDVPLIGDLEDPVALQKKLRFLYELKHEQLGKAMEPTLLAMRPEFLMELYNGFTDLVGIVDRKWLAPELEKGTTVFEGAQGLLLDQDFGFQPHTTWSDTTFRNAATLLEEGLFAGLVTRVGVTRSYHTRHGQGPFPSEIVGVELNRELHNSSDNMQGKFRNGFLDMVLLKYALEIQPMDQIALTHLDKGAHWIICTSYRHPEFKGGIPIKRPADYQYQLKMAKALSEVSQLNTRVIHAASEDLPTLIQRTCGVPVTITSDGPRLCDKSPAHEEIPVS